MRNFSITTTSNNSIRSIRKLWKGENIRSLKPKDPIAVITVCVASVDKKEYKILNFVQPD